MKFEIRNMWLLEALGGAFLALFLRWSDVLFLVRTIGMNLFSWAGIAGPELIALALAYYSRFGSSVFIVITGITGGVSFVQMGATLVALGVWEVKERQNKSQDKKMNWKQLPVVWSILVLLIITFLAIRIPL